MQMKVFENKDYQLDTYRYYPLGLPFMSTQYHPLYT